MLSYSGTFFKDKIVFRAILNIVNLRNIFGWLWKYSYVFENRRVIFGSRENPRIWISRIWLRESWQVYIISTALEETWTSDEFKVWAACPSTLTRTGSKVEICVIDLTAREDKKLADFGLAREFIALKRTDAQQDDGSWMSSYTQYYLNSGILSWLIEKQFTMPL